MKNLFVNSFDKVERKSLADLSSSSKNIDKSESEKIEGGCFFCTFFDFHLTVGETYFLRERGISPMA